VKGNLSAGDLASLLGVTTRTLRRWEEDGSGPKRVIENLEPAYPLETLVPWLQKHHPHVKLGEAANVESKASRGKLLEAWERVLCKRYGLDSTEALYEALRHADFHNTGSGAGMPDELQYWHLAAYASFSGTIVRHQLSPEDLKDLLETFASRNDLGLAKKKNVSVAEFTEQIEEGLTEDGFEEFVQEGGRNLTKTGPHNIRRLRDHVAIGFRYACCVANDYIWPDPYLSGKLTRAQMEQLNQYLEFIYTKRLIPACKYVQAAGQRHIDDLIKARASA
jgi:hypothetical protein